MSGGGLNWDKDRDRQRRNQARQAAKPPTTRQLIWIAKLCKERGVHVHAPTDRTDASHLIKKLIDMPRRTSYHTGRVNRKTP